MIYLDNAATTRLCDEALRSMQPYLGESFFNANSSYAEARIIKKAVEDAREKMAGMIGADSSYIYFTSGGSESDSWIILGTAMHYISNKESVHIIVSKVEHHAVLNSCKMAELLGASITYLDVDKYGRVDQDSLINAIRPDTRLISVMLVNNELGTINDIGALCKAVKQYNENIIFHTDAVQAFGNIPIDVKELGIDALSLSGHKFNGPKGIGLLYCKSMDKISSIILGGEQESGRRGGTTNSAGIIGMAAAGEHAISCMDIKKKKCHILRNELIKILSNSDIEFEINGIDINDNSLYENSDNNWPGILNINFGNISGERLISLLEHDGILCSKAAACDGNGRGNDESRSHVLKAIGLDDSRVDSSVRLSFGIDNEVEDVKYASKKIIERVNLLKLMG